MGRASWPLPRGKGGGGRLGKQAGAQCRNSGPCWDLCSERCLWKGGNTDSGGCWDWSRGSWEAVLLQELLRALGKERKGETWNLAGLQRNAAVLTRSRGVGVAGEGVAGEGVAGWGGASLVEKLPCGRG